MLLMITMSGIIYKISSDKGPKVYYGSTTTTLAKRFGHHKTHMNCSSSVLFEEYGIDNCIAETVEEVTIGSLLERERYWIESDANCVNIRRAWVSEEEQKESNRESSREYREQNKDQIKEYRREYHEQNKERSNQLNREWRERNKEKIKEYDRLRYLKKKASSPDILSL